MGGCYSYDEDRSSRSYTPPVESWKISAGMSVSSFFKDHDVADLVKAYTKYSEENTSGFIRYVLEKQDCKEAPKEFPEIEYEVKFSIMPTSSKKNAQEPSLEEYLDAFDFPPVAHAHFLKDRVNAISEGTNHFYGKGDEEHLVVIEKMGKTYLKEKSQPLPLDTNVQYQDVVIKRTEKRYEAALPEVLQKTAAVTAAGGVYQGRIRKEKGDAFLLDTHDGRIYSFTLTRAHAQSGVIQRQLEIEYAGFIPGFEGFVKDSEEQIVAGMVDVAKYIAFFGRNARLGKGWMMNVQLTHERKYDFVAGKSMPEPVALLEDTIQPLTIDVVKGVKAKKNKQLD